MDKDKFATCALCMERKYANRTVYGDGSPKLAKVCLLGRNPGRDEDRLGVPFIGRAGRKLDQGLVIASLLRRECYTTNISKCMTPPNIAPSAVCRRTCVDAWLNEELASLERLELIVTLGNEALRYFEPLGRVGELQGTHFDTVKPWMAQKIHIFVSYHPSAALRSTSVHEKFMIGMERLGEYIAVNTTA